MEARRSGSALIVIMFILGLALLGVGLTANYHFSAEFEAYQSSRAEADAAFLAYSPSPFINSAAEAEAYVPYDPREDALFLYEAPEGFFIISHSTHWNQHMLELLYHELMLNEHGEEIDFLHEIIIFPYAEEEGSMLASYSLATTAVNFFVMFPAFPDDFAIAFPQIIGRINLYDGDTLNTIESIAGSLSHEYGHLFTFYHMFDNESDEDGSLERTTYAGLREALQNNLLTSATPGVTYMRERHRYLFEIAAEDYVQLMGSPTTRRVVDFVDVQQVINGAEHPASISGARNAFPQENMMLPLANDVPGLKAYFFSFVDAEPRVPIEEKQDVTLDIRRNSVQHNLVSGLRTFVYYTITWNTPYQDAIYTLVCYDPFDYSGWGHPIKTVHPGNAGSAIIGEYVVERGEQVVTMDDGLAEGVKVFFVVALLPDGTFYISEKLEYEF